MYKSFFSFCCILFLFASCSPFSKHARHTEIGLEKMHTLVYNDEVNFRSLTFGDFDFARSMQEYKDLKDGKPEFKHILFYAQAQDPDYEYYVLMNPRKKEIDEQRYYSEEITIEKNRFFFIISADAPESDAKFIEENIKSIQ